MRILLMAFVFFVGGCASDGKQEAAATDGTTKICTYEKELGSHIKTRKCRTVREIERNRTSAAEDLRANTVSTDQ